MLEEFHVKYDMLPEYMRGAARGWVEYGQPPGDFLTCVLRNDLTGSFGAADDENFRRMADWVRWLYNECPHGAKGDRMDAWSAQGGLRGIHAKRKHAQGR